LTKIWLVIQEFTFTLDQVQYLHDHGADFASLADNNPPDLGALTPGTWLRLLSYRFHLVKIAWLHGCGQ
jgi:hypothetical protein